MAESSLPDLLRPCLDADDPDAWTRFVSASYRLVAATVLRTVRRFEEPRSDVVDDLIQDTYLRLCDDNRRVLRGFRNQHPDALYGLIQSVAYTVVHDHFRARAAVKRGGAAPTLSFDDHKAAPVHTGALQDLDFNLLLGQIDGVLLESAAPENAGRDRTIFWLYYRHGLTAAAIASLPSIALGQKGVESVIRRLTGEIRRRFLPASGPRPARAG